MRASMLDGIDDARAERMNCAMCDLNGYAISRIIISISIQSFTQLFHVFVYYK